MATITKINNGAINDESAWGVFDQHLFSTVIIETAGPIPTDPNCNSCVFSYDRLIEQGAS